MHSAGTTLGKGTAGLNLRVLEPLGVWVKEEQGGAVKTPTGAEPEAARARRQLKEQPEEQAHGEKQSEERTLGKEKPGEQAHWRRRSPRPPLTRETRSEVLEPK